MVAILLSMINHNLFSQTSYFIPCVFALIGHCYPVYYKFKGGKAVSCFLGLLLVVNVLYLIIFLIV
ncbi:glycerol-3-phosphate acyltransferase [Vibrio harveyi]|nr:glycerol-3-phosphate acyltransferase [Vibrio harveyi]